MLFWSLHRPLLVFKTNIENDDANQYGREVRSTGTTILLYPGSPGEGSGKLVVVTYPYSACRHVNCHYHLQGDHNLFIVMPMALDFMDRNQVRRSNQPQFI